jgi:hypothetical protein
MGYVFNTVLWCTSETFYQLSATGTCSSCINVCSLFEANFHFGGVAAACLHFILALLTYPLLRRLIKVYLHCVIPDVFWCCIIIVAPLACLLFIRHPLPSPSRSREYIKSFPLERPRATPSRCVFFCTLRLYRILKHDGRSNRRCFTLGNNVIQAAGASWIKRLCYLWIGLVIPHCALNTIVYIMMLLQRASHYLWSCIIWRGRLLTHCAHESVFDGFVRLSGAFKHLLVTEQVLTG